MASLEAYAGPLFIHEQLCQHEGIGFPLILASQRSHRDESISKRLLEPIPSASALKGALLPKLVFCAPLVLLATCAVAGCGSTAVTIAATIPTHQCASGNYKTSAYQGRHAYGANYMVENDVWNPEQISQTLYSCSFDSFYVEANVQNRGGAVQSYPSSQYTFATKPKISNFKSLASDFRVSSPPTGPRLDYEFAYDIWFNGYGGSHHTEMMIWTYTNGRRPAGRELPETADIDGHIFEVWVYGGGGYIVTFEAVNNYTAAATDLLPFFAYASSRGWLYDGTSTPLWQIDYGAELSATPGVTKFAVTDFSIAFKT